MQERVCTITELGHRVLSYEELKILLEKTPAKGILVDKIAWVDSEQNMLSKLDFADTHSREKSLMSEFTNCWAGITCKLEGMLKNVELSSVDVEKPSSEEEARIAFKETAGQKGDHDHRVLKTVVRVDK